MILWTQRDTLLATQYNTVMGGLSGGLCKSWPLDIYYGPETYSIDSEGLKDTFWTTHYHSYSFKVVVGVGWLPKHKIVTA